VLGQVVGTHASAAEDLYRHHVAVVVDREARVSVLEMRFWLSWKHQNLSLRVPCTRLLHQLLRKPALFN
jgi:hypothetical protein